MKSRTWMFAAVVYLFAALAIPVWTAAQNNQENKAQPSHSPYTGGVGPRHQNSAHAVAGSVNDSNRDVRYTVTAVGVVPGEQSSFLPVVESVNNSGAVAGYSYNGQFAGSNDFF